MDSVEVAVRFTEAIMLKSSPARGTDPAETYVDMFAQVLNRVNAVMNPLPAAVPPPPPPAPKATSEVFPLTHERRE